MKKLADFAKIKEAYLYPSDKNVVGLIHPAPKDCLVNTKLCDLGYLYPFFSVEGKAINKKYKGLKFHFLANPTHLNYMDYRLLEDNRYEIVGTNKHKVSDLKILILFWKH